LINIKINLLFVYYFYIDLYTENKNIESRRVKGNLISIYLINSIVLLTLSIIGFIYLNSSKVENYFKENVLVNIYLKNSTKEFENKQLIKYLNLNDNIKEITYLSKEEAAEIFTDEIGEEFIGFLGYNPLLDAISIKLYGEKIDTYTIEELIFNLENFEFIEEIEYDRKLVDSLSRNFKKIGLWVIILSAFFVLTSFLLINNSIKISIYSKKDIIKTMQLVGATKGFIRKPFIWTYIKIGFISSATSILILLIILYQLNNQTDEFNFFLDTKSIFTLSSFILIFGFSTSFISSFLVTQKYLKVKFKR